jgi:hypothetical protein
MQYALGLQPVAFAGPHGTDDDHRQQKPAIHQQSDAGKFRELYIAAQRIDKREDTNAEENKARDKKQAPRSEVLGGGSHKAIYKNNPGPNPFSVNDFAFATKESGQKACKNQKWALCLYHNRAPTLDNPHRTQVPRNTSTFNILYFLI